MDPCPLSSAGESLMRSKKFSVGLTAMLAMLAVTLFMTSARATAQQEKILHSFNGTDGSGPGAPLVMDAKGNFYGTTPTGGTARAAAPGVAQFSS